MKYLVDTHVLLWSFIEPEQLSKTVSRELLNEDNDVYYSPINLWEIAIKYGLKKLDLKGISPGEFFEELDNSYFLCKSIENIDLITSYQLPRRHKDPFDRFLVWEAIKNDLVLMSVDTTMELYKQDGLKTVF